MEPRIPIFQRKSESIEAAESPIGSPKDNKAAPQNGAEIPVVCPNCACEFDATSGEILNPEQYEEGAMMAEAEGVPSPSDMEGMV